MRNAVTRTTLAVLAAFTLAGAAVSAHHVYSGDFALDREATVTGVIEGIRFQNPHVLIVVRTPGAGRFTAEWHGAGWLQSHPELVSPKANPVTSDTLKPGDQIVLVGAPARDTALRSMVNVKEIRRPRDGWLWSCRRADAPRACGMM